MNTLDFKSCGISELDKSQLHEVSGGFIKAITKALGPYGWAFAALAWCYDNQDDIKEGYNSYKPRYIGNE